VLWQRARNTQKWKVTWGVNIGMQLQCNARDARDVPDHNSRAVMAELQPTTQRLGALCASLGTPQPRSITKRQWGEDDFSGAWGCIAWVRCRRARVPGVRQMNGLPQWVFDQQPPRRGSPCAWPRLTHLIASSLPVPRGTQCRLGHMAAGHRAGSTSRFAAPAARSRSLTGHPCQTSCMGSGGGGAMMMLPSLGSLQSGTGSRQV
jgi:hypothetical protein